MAVILQQSDFKGEIEVAFPSLGGRATLIMQMISNVELRLIYQLFGNTVAPLFVANPTNPQFAGLFAPIYENDCFSASIKDVFAKLCYLEIQNKISSMGVENGRVVKKSENGANTMLYAKDLDMYNRAIDGWKALCYFGSKNITDFNYTDKKYVFY